MNLSQNKLNSINVKKLRTSIDREIHKASSYNPTLDGLSAIDNTMVEKPFLDGNIDPELNLLGRVNNESPIANQIKNREGILNRNNIVNVLINDQGKVLLDDKPTQMKDIKRKAIDRIKRNEKIIFSVLTTKRTKYKYYIEVLDQLKQAGASKISIANPPNF